MPARQSAAEASRAEARRRARAIARGEEVEPLPTQAAGASTSTTTSGRPPSLLTRFFPPAPPLPGKGDPLAGYTYRGRFSGIRSGAWLLFRHPLYWGVPAAGWAILQFVLTRATSPGTNLIALGVTFGQYALLIGAGWVGWWRPWLFGTASAIFGVLLYGLIEAAGVIQEGGTATEGLLVFAGLSTLVTLYGLVGAFAGFYGGYIRRRMAIPPAGRAGSKGKRR
jgi:hypothetical protein